VFLDYFDVLMSKINFKKIKNIYYFDIFPNKNYLKKHYLKKQPLHTPNHSFHAINPKRFQPKNPTTPGQPPRSHQAPLMAITPISQWKQEQHKGIKNTTTKNSAMLKKKKPELCNH